jgi:arginase
MMEADQFLHLIGVASGWGAKDPGTGSGPESLRSLGLVERLNQAGVACTWRGTLAPVKTFNAPLPYVVEVDTRLNAAVLETLRERLFPVILGGDHSIAIGTWSGVKSFLGEGQKLGLIWIDAHMDAHTFETSLSKSIHGMPVASLLGYGPSELAKIGGPLAKIDPENIILIGVRSYESGEAELLKRLNVKIYYMDEVKERGFVAVFDEAWQKLKDSTQAVGLTIDVDAFDPEDAPGTAASEPDGLKIAEVLPALKGKGQGLIALELVEYNPNLDVDHKTAKLIEDLLINIMGKSS